MSLKLMLCGQYTWWWSTMVLSCLICH